ncbi:MAG: hypothetical protein ACP5IZ_07340 [Thermoprotei archaeon]
MKSRSLAGGAVLFITTPVAQVDLLSWFLSEFSKYVTWFLQLIGQALRLLFSGFAKLIGLDRAIIFFIVELPTSNAKASGDAQLIAAANTMTNLYRVTEPIALYLLVIALFIAGIAYALESFRIISEGTAFNILANSIMTPILIIAFPYLYNAVVGIINTITLPPSYGGSGVILQDNTIATLIGNAFNPSVNATHIGVTEQLANYLAGVFLDFIILVMLIITAFSIAILGALRYLLIVSLYVAMPIILVLRLIPITRGVAQTLMDEFIGLITSSLIVAIFLRTATDITSVQSGGGGLIGQMMAIGALIAAPLFITLFSSKLGRMFSAVQGVINQSVGTGLTIGTIGVGAIAGGLTSTIGGGIGFIRGAGGLSTLGATTGLGSRIVGWAELHGGKLGTLAQKVALPTVGIGAALPHALKSGAVGTWRGAASAKTGIGALKEGEITHGLKHTLAPITTVPLSTHNEAFHEGVKRQTTSLVYAPLESSIPSKTTADFRYLQMEPYVPPIEKFQQGLLEKYSSIKTEYPLTTIGKNSSGKELRSVESTLDAKGAKNYDKLILDKKLWKKDVVSVANSDPEKAFGKVMDKYLGSAKIVTGLKNKKIMSLKDYIDSLDENKKASFINHLGNEAKKAHQVISNALPAHRPHAHLNYTSKSVAFKEAYEAKEINMETHQHLIAKGTGGKGKTKGKV